MPESKRRKRKPNGRSKVAALDGVIIKLKACCRIELEIGYPYCHCYHDNDCPVPNDRSVAGYYRRVQIIMMFREKLQSQGIRTIVVLDTHGSEPILLVP